MLKDYTRDISFSLEYPGIYQPAYVLMWVDLMDDCDPSIFKEEMDKIDEFKPFKLEIVISNLANETITKKYE